MIRILLVDDHAMVRKGFQLILSSQPDMTIVGEAGTGRDALAMADKLGPDVVVMDVAMPELNGIEATRKIMTAEQYQARVHQAETEFPLKRGIWPIDVARAALFLVADAVVMTGECLRMDAGEHLGANLIRA